MEKKRSLIKRKIVPFNESDKAFMNHHQISTINRTIVTVALCHLLTFVRGIIEMLSLMISTIVMGNPFAVSVNNGLFMQSSKEKDLTQLERRSNQTFPSCNIFKIVSFALLLLLLLLTMFFLENSGKQQSQMCHISVSFSRCFMIPFNCLIILTPLS